MNSNNLAKRTLVELVVVMALLLALAIWQFEFLRSVYLTKDQTQLGIIINGIILLIFAAGTFKIMRALYHYTFEEEQLERFVRHANQGDDRISSRSIIGRRYDQVRQLYERKIPINHGVMASAMMAEESLYQSFPKFVNNILILLGVFGTVISLILALAGASDVLQNSVTGNGMWQIIHGMHTALSTTASAIVCFFVFSFFYHRLTDVQTRYFGRIENVVMTYLVTEFAFDSETLNYKTDRLIGEMHDTLKVIRAGAKVVHTAVERMESGRTQQLDALQNLNVHQERQTDRTDAMMAELTHIKRVLKNGFRLKD